MLLQPFRFIVDPGTTVVVKFDAGRTIHGNHKRERCLNNELYIGTIVWNRLRYLKDSHRQARVATNPSVEWEHSDVPGLGIIDADLWAAAKARQATTRQSKTTALVRARQPNICFPASRSAPSAAAVLRCDPTIG